MKTLQNDAYSWLEVVNLEAKVGGVRYALFDFDGTLSVIRQGWEKIMIAVMLESICEDQPPTPEIEAVVTQYVDQSTGILTIKQMKWLEQAVIRHGIAKNQRSASAYKRIYLDRLLLPVYERLGQIDDSQAARQSWMVAGASDFLCHLTQRGVRLFLASGTDQEYVLKEAEALGVDHFFDGQRRDVLDFNAVIDQPRYAFVCLMACEGVSVHLSNQRCTGVLSVSQKFNRAVAKSSRQEPPPDCGIDTLSFGCRNAGPVARTWQ